MQVGLSDADLDEGERFDALEREKLLATNPDSVAYYQVFARPSFPVRAGPTARALRRTPRARARAPFSRAERSNVTTRVPSAVLAQAIRHNHDARHGPHATLARHTARQRIGRNGTGRVVSQAQKNHLHNVNTRKVGAPKAPAKKAR